MRFFDILGVPDFQGRKIRIIQMFVKKSQRGKYHIRQLITVLWNDKVPPHIKLLLRAL